MVAENGTVHKLETVNEARVEEKEEVQASSQQGMINAQSDMSKVSMIVSLLAVLLLVIFFFGMNRNIAGLTDEVNSLGVLREDVATLDERMMELKKDVPVQMKRLIAHDMVNDMAMKSSYLINSMDDEALRMKMQTIYTELEAVRAGLEK